MAYLLLRHRVVIMRQYAEARYKWSTDLDTFLMHGPQSKDSLIWPLRPFEGVAVKLETNLRWFKYYIG